MAFVCALFSKETAVALPLVYIAFLVFGQIRYKDFRKLASIAVPWAIITVIYLFVRSKAVGNSPTLAKQIGDLFLNLPAIPETVAKFVFPVRLSPIPTFSMIFSILGLAILAGCVWRGIAGKGNKPAIWQGLIWFVATSLPAMAYNNKSLGGYDYLPHRQFLPLIGMMVTAVGLLPTKFKSKNAFVGITLIVAVLYGGLTINYSPIFANPTVFCNAAIASNPSSPNAYEARASLESDAGDRQSAIADYGRALALIPSAQTALINHANLLGESGDTTNAFADFSALMQAKPKWSRPFLDRGKWRLSAGNLAGAKSDFDRAIILDSAYSDAYNNLGTICLMQSDTSAAERYYLKAISFDKSHADALYNYGLIRLWKNDLAGACNAWKNAAALGSKPAQESLANHCKN